MSRLFSKPNTPNSGVIYGTFGEGPAACHTAYVWNKDYSGGGVGLTQAEAYKNAREELNDPERREAHIPHEY